MWLGWCHPLKALFGHFFQNTVYFKSNTVFTYIQHFYSILQSKIYLCKNGLYKIFLIFSSSFHLWSWLGVLNFLRWFLKLNHALLAIKTVSSNIFPYCIIPYCKVNPLTTLGQTLTFLVKVDFFGQTLTFLKLCTFSSFFTQKAVCST